MAEALPDSASSAVYLHLAAARIKELHHLDQELAGCKSGKGGRCYQKLPRHMQRRALSSKPKRLPRRLRHRHLAEGEPPRPTKRPASKHRPRPRVRPSSSAPNDPISADSLTADDPQSSDAEATVAAGRASCRSRVEDYARRQSTHGNTWLETHVWHAKRFHMERRWGYALPLRPTQKMYRPTLRAVEQRCVMQDVSFLCCVEVRGTALLTALRTCTSQCARRRLQSVWDGASLAWHSFTLYQPHRCPLAAVCQVELQRLPNALPLNESQEQDDEESRVWMWVHPASHDDLLGLLCEVFALQRVSRSDCVSTTERNSGTAHEEDKENCDVIHVDDESIKSGGVKGASLSDDSPLPNSAAAGCPVDDLTSIPKSKVKRKHQLLQARMSLAGVPDYISKDKKASIFCLKDTLNRFHLRGPEAYNILQSILVPSSVIPEPLEKMSKPGTNKPLVVKLSDSSVQSSSKISGKDPDPVKKSSDSSVTCYDGNPANHGNGMNCAEDERDSSSWWQSYYACPQRQAEQHASSHCWAEEPCVEDNVVLPLVVRDPRVLLPCKRAKIHPSRAGTARRPLSVKDVSSCSPLYDPALRLLMLRQRRADHQINGVRQHSGVPGAVLPLTSEEARLPVLLLLRRTRQSAGAPPARDSCDMAYDVIIPGGWGSNFWMALLYAGAVAVGVDSEVHFMREEHTPPPSYLLPDLPAGRRYEQLRARELRQEHFNLPPDKRPNFIKLGVQFPFSFPWPKLISSLRNQPSFRSTLDKEIGMGFSDEVLQQLGLPQAKSEDVNENTDSQISCVLRNTRYLRALDLLSCRSGSRRRIFRGLDPESKEAHDNPEDAQLSGDLPKGTSAQGLLNPSSALTEDLTALQETIALMQRTSQLQLVRVQVTLIGKGSVEPMALICRPSASDVQHLKEVLTNEQRPSLDVSAGIVEPSRPDEHEEKRKQLKQEHERDQTKIHRLRKAARRRVRRGHEDGSGSLAEALNDALQSLNCQQQELISRKESYASAMESLWLLPPELPLQQCSRLIVGCLTDASFSRLRGCGVGQGFISVGALLPICQRRLERWQRCAAQLSEDREGQAPRKKQKLNDGSSCGSASVGACEADQVHPEAPGGHEEEGVDVDLPFIEERGIAVLVRNKNSLQYRFGLLTVCCHQPPS